MKYGAAIMKLSILCIIFAFSNASNDHQEFMCCSLSEGLCNSGSEWCEESSEHCQSCGGDWINPSHAVRALTSTCVEPRGACTPGTSVCCDPFGRGYQCVKWRLDSVSRCFKYSEPDACCSRDQGQCYYQHNFRNVSNHFCGNSQSNCLGCGMYWIFPPELGNCLPHRWSCSPSTDTCCGDLVQCLPDRLGDHRCYHEEDLILPDECCSINQGECTIFYGSNCGDSQSNCLECGHYWIFPPELGDCLPEKRVCSPSTDTCCGDLRCLKNRWGEHKCYKEEDLVFPDECCSEDQGTCLTGGGACLESQSACLDRGMYWIFPPELGNCLPERWACSPSTDTCCGDLQCLIDNQGDQKCYKEEDERIILPRECCSLDQASCVLNHPMGCHESQSACLACEMYWIPPHERSDCLIEQQLCSPSTDTCCGDLQCLQNRWGEHKCYSEEDLIFPDECCSEDQGTCLGDGHLRCKGSKEQCERCDGLYWIITQELGTCRPMGHRCNVTADCCGDDTQCFLSQDLVNRTCNTHDNGVFQPPLTPPPTPLPSTPPTSTSTPTSSPTTNPPTPTPTPPPTTTHPTTAPSLPPTPPPTLLPALPPTLPPTLLPALPPTLPPTPLPTSAPSLDPILQPVPASVLPTDLPSTPVPTTDGTIIGPRNNSERVKLKRPATDAGDTAQQHNCPHNKDGLDDWNSLFAWARIGQDISIGDNKRIVLRESVATTLGVITIPESSELIIGENPNGITLDVEGIDVRGSLTIGSETCRIVHKVTITLHGTRPVNAVANVPDPRYKGISVSGGTISLHGKRYFQTWTRLATTVQPGAYSLRLQEDVNWEPNQEIVLVTTAMKDSKDWHQNEQLRVQSVDNSPSVGCVVYLESQVNFKHVGIQAYQAEVGLLTRTILIQGGADDSEPWDSEPSVCSGQTTTVIRTHRAGTQI